MGWKEIDFCYPSDERWDFALTLLTIMDTGDYMQQMLDVSVKKFNSGEQR